MNTVADQRTRTDNERDAHADGYIETHGMAAHPDANSIVTALDLADSYTRAEALLRVYFHKVLSRNDWFKRAGEEWSGCDNIGLYRLRFARILRGANRAELDLMMDAGERATLTALPEMLTVYRGCYEFNRIGLSWTLSEDVARAFVTKYRRYVCEGKAPLLLTGLVRKSTCVLKLERCEQEVIAPRVSCTDTTMLQVEVPQ